MTPDGAGGVLRPNPFPLWVRALLFAAAYFVCAVAGDFLSVPNGVYVSFWLPSGLSVAVLLLTERREWPWLMVAAFLANALFDLFNGANPVLIIFFASGNVLQASLGAWLFQRFIGKKPNFTTVKEFIGFVALVAVLSTAVGSVAGAWAMAHFGSADSFGHLYKIWWAGWAMAVLILSPFLLVWAARQPGHHHLLNRPMKRLEALLLFALLALCDWYVLMTKGGIMSPYKAWLIPLLLWSGLRFGTRGATAATLLVSLMTAFFTSHYLTGLTPTQVASGEYVFILQTVLASASLVALIPALALVERDETLAKLKENEEHLKNLTRAAFEGIAISENGRLLDVNDQMLKMFDYERGELIGKQIVDIVDPQSREVVAEAIRTGRESTYEHRLLRKDGSSFVAEARAKVVRRGERTLRMTALRDITDRKLSEEMNKTQSHVLEMITRGEPLAKTLDALLRMIEKQSPEMLCSILLLQPDGIHVMHGAAPSLPVEYVKAIDGSKIGPRAGSCGTAAYRREPVFVADIATDPLWEGYRELALAHGLRSCWASPILDAQRKALGTFAIYHRVPGLPTERELRLIDVATHSAAVCISKHAGDEALRESEDRFRTLVESSPDCIAVAVNERLAYLNPAGLKLIRAKSLDEILGRSVYTFAPEEMSEGLQVRRRTVLERATASPIIEFQLRRQDGSSVLVESQAVPFVYSGQPAILNLIRDITERKRAEVEQALAGQREQKAREEFTHLLISSQEAERRRIARELHDSLGQNLSIIKSRAHLAAQQFSQPSSAATHIEAIERIASEAIDETRSLAHNLRPMHIEHAGLTASLQELIREVSQSSEVYFQRRVENVDGIFKGEAATNVYRVVQEALNNLIKHSHAQQAMITVERDIRTVRLRIADDGVGFDTGEEMGRQGLGLTSISERVRMLGGTLCIQSAPNHGTQLTIELPIAAEVEEVAPVEGTSQA